MRRVTLDRLDEVGDQVVPPLQLHVDLRPCVFDPVAEPDQAVVERDRDEHEHDHDRRNIEAVTNARAAAQSATGPAEQGAAEGLLSAALGRLIAVAEAYPELQADENFRQLQEELAQTENRIAVSRQVYNDTVLTYNTAIQTVPGVFFAGPFGFTKRDFFEAEDATREAPRVAF